MDIRKKIHFVGIGGAGMSGLSQVFHCRGYTVQGSDIKKTKVTDRLESIGIDVNRFHSAENIKDADYVVYSSCIREDNVELKEARRKNIPVLRRIEALNMLVEDKKLIAVSGTHGKSTTTTLISYILIKARMDPTVFIGADVDFLNGNACFGTSDLVITEADESDGSFLLLNPLYSVATNLDKEHMDYYSDMDGVIASYRRFIENTKDEGCAFVCIDDYNLKGIVKDSPRRIMRYGLCNDADIKACNIELLGFDGARFDLVFKNKVLGKVSSPLIGMHNILNSLAAIGVALDLGIEFSFIKDALPAFKSPERRFAITRLDSDIFVIDDYAHHPTEIKATLKTVEALGRRIVVVFQPHRYSRTKYLNEEFGTCFSAAGHVVITDIYSAYEEPIDNVTAQDLCRSIKKSGHKSVCFVAKDDIIGHLTEVVKPGDVLFVLGAGDIGDLPEMLVKALEVVRF